ncbi:indolepyruvate ferredoxin oxidoreductase family protein [Janthinobacterium sp. GW458P]|uniref:indolepyruvate ferredoxin oxidoreductase family protein n=1 Tax=Janthinobacterium sp. GW458P TaxID=1981504 RepID=UPI000A32150A|nr:indolepyruvate ferredoxin oxidoreductase family protein [Janthinobacterium sp. GW458P]MBE3026001.1 indolepyruvate ferredoxin oxidoreductase family protein [Janthinobacterium sp. GW458P]
MNARITPQAEAQPTSLDDRFLLEKGQVYLTGNQALVRIALDQRRLDAAQGKNTAGFISGYRGSPLGRFDMELWRVAPVLKAAQVHFQPGVNEDLAATAVWGSQFVGSFPGARVDGVFGIWYGKSPGVDRAGDPLKHGNLAGTSPLGGVLVLAGDDHSAKSSTTAHQSDFALIAAGIPVLYPANVQDILDFSLRGIEMSRQTGCWVGIKLVTDVVESAAEVTVGQLAPLPQPTPAAATPCTSLHIRKFEMAPAAEERLYVHKLPAAVAFARMAGLNQLVWPAPQARVGIITAGKSYADTMQALTRLGVTADGPVGQRLRLLKIGMVWPLEDQIVRDFAQGLETILVVEEKRPLLEAQLKSILFDARLSPPPVVRGKFDGAPEWSSLRGRPELPICYELNTGQIGAAIAKLLEMAVAAGSAPACQAPAGAVPLRKPSFCAGCPHNISTRLPQESRALAGIGCHTIAMLNDPLKTNTVSHMGGEGVMWMGQAPFTDEEHVFANMGDGTYFHSGYLAIRQAVAANLRMTYKLLFNGFVSMTGGQPIDGDISVDKAVAQLQAEGVRKIVIVTDDVAAYAQRRQALNVPIWDRAAMERVQQELRAYPGLSVLIYDQACATEKRRLRKRGQLPDPQVRTYIDPEVCEGCGDCGEQSGCLAIEPLDTPLGRKRKINQSSCNKDLSCVQGFCPSFVTLHGATLRKAGGAAALTIPPLPSPAVADRFEPVSLLVAGIGGTGVVTIGAVLTMAAHLDGKAGSSLDLTGISQKYGAVASHIRLAPTAGELHAARIGEHEADVLLGCDLIVAAGAEAMSCLRPGLARAIVNTEVVPTSDFTRQPDWSADADSLAQGMRSVLGERARFVDASALAQALLGDAILSNMLLLGCAWQQGLLPVKLDAMRRAIELNGVAVKANLRAFDVGRWLIHDPAAVQRQVLPAQQVHFARAQQPSLPALIEDRCARLQVYQDAELAALYRERMQGLRAALGQEAVSEKILRQVATQYFRVLAVKDEFEVARLYSRKEFRQSLAGSFEGDFQIRFHLAGGPFGKTDAATGQVRKTAVGAWVLPAFRLLASLRFLRGGKLDPFARGAEAALNRRIRSLYEDDLARIAQGKDSGGQMLELASWPEGIRGYGHVRARMADAALARRAGIAVCSPLTAVQPTL